MTSESRHGEPSGSANGQSAELDLEDDESLPWLESDEDERDGSSVDTTQIVGFGFILAAILVAVVGGVWYISNSGGSGGPEPDGSVIAAPEGPIKERPEDPGGKEFAGTGNVAPVVGEGGTRESRLAVADDPPAEPAPASAPETDEPAVSEPAPEPEPTATSGVGVQLAAYRSRERAQRGWRELRARTDVLNGVDYRIVRGVVDIGTVYRLQAIASDRAAGNALCEALKADGLDCQVKS